jgi:hypothetical protein
MITREARQLIVSFCRQSTNLDRPSNSALNKERNVAVNVAGTSLVHTSAHSGTCNELIIISLCVRLACFRRHKRTSDSRQSNVNPVQKINSVVKRSSGMSSGMSTQLYVHPAVCPPSGMSTHKRTPKENSESELQ